MHSGHLHDVLILVVVDVKHLAHDCYASIEYENSNIDGLQLLSNLVVISQSTKLGEIGDDLHHLDTRVGLLDILPALCHLLWVACDNANVEALLRKVLAECEA